ncbi:hypothetical protein [Sinorhizobium sojae]|uniref:hypothetical protein n=1 Tax=Sinorhizobium sojae TaxID=716925 RepID=UPI000680D72E|nr:hypothetical protein [Sinorhizobium sojae]
MSDLFSKSHARKGITVDGVTYLQDKNSGDAKIFSGLADAQVMKYFEELTGQTLPNPRAIPPNAHHGGGVLYVVKTPAGNFNLRSMSSSGSQTAARWTIDVPKAIAGTSKDAELKFR